MGQANASLNHARLTQESKEKETTGTGAVLQLALHTLAGILSPVYPDYRAFDDKLSQTVTLSRL